MIFAVVNKAAVLAWVAAPRFKFDPPVTSMSNPGKRCCFSFAKNNQRNFGWRPFL